MLTLTEIASLQKKLRTKRVLSVYFSAKTRDPSQRRAWKPLLNAELRAWSRLLQDVDPAERREFTSARQALEAALALADVPHADGIVGFSTAGSVQLLEALPFKIDTTVVWGRGIALAPYVRALKQERGVVLAVMDGKTAHVYWYQFEQFRLLETIAVEPHLTQPTHMGASVSPTFHPGVRGTSGQDEAQHEWSAAMDRVTRRLAQRITHYAGEDSWVLIGGRDDAVRKTIAALSRAVQQRTGDAMGVSVHSPTHALTKVARDGASYLRGAADAQALRHLAESAGEREAAAVGESAVRRALEGSRVAQLYVSARFVKEHAEHAEAAVRSALEQSAGIETVSGEAGTSLDGMGGIAARLRYAVRPPVGQLPVAAHHSTDSGFRLRPVE